MQESLRLALEAFRQDVEDVAKFVKPVALASCARPALLALAVAVLHGDKLFMAIRPYAKHHERAEEVVLETDVKMDPVDPDVHVVSIAQVLPRKGLILLLPDVRQSGHVR